MKKTFYKKVKAPYSMVASMYSLEEIKGKMKWINLPMRSPFKVDDAILKKGADCYVGIKTINSDGSIDLLVYWLSKTEKAKYGTYIHFDSDSEAKEEGWNYA